MSEPMDIEEMLAAAGQAVSNGDLAAADTLLRDAAQDQESKLGPLHPDLATTLNNRAIVAEKIGRQKDAEMFYRRAAAIASASLPAGDAMVAETRQNLEDFCRARGLPLDQAVVKMPSAPDRPRPPVKPAAPRVAAPERVKPPVVPAAVRSLPDPPVPTRTAPQADVPSSPIPTPLSASARTPRAGLWAAIGVVLVLVAVVLVMRSRSPEPSTATTAGESVRQAAEPNRSAAAEPAVPTHRDQAAPPATPPRDERRGAVSEPSPRRTVSAAGISVTHAELCRTLSTRRGAWQCKPAGDVVAPGPLVFYTRIAAPRNASVTHRWYRGETSRQTVRLTIHPNGTSGYRTYTRQTVTPGEWRVEVRSSAGDLLGEKRFTVK